MLAVEEEAMANGQRGARNKVERAKYFAVSSAVPIHQKPIDILSCDSFDVEE